MRLWKMLLYPALGAIIGGVLGYLQQCAGGTCPLMCVWWRGAVFGAAAGLALWFAGRAPAQPAAPAKPNPDDVADKPSQT